MSREVAGRHFEYEYRNECTGGEWRRTDFEPPLPETRCEAEKRLDTEVRGWVEGT